MVQREEGESLSKLENDCLSMLIYAAKQNGRWCELGEIADAECIPLSTIRNIFHVSKTGIFIKEDGEKTSIHMDAFAKIATKYHFDYQIKKMPNSKGRLTWHLCAVKIPYDNQC